ncbi:MAG: site-specific integrase [bacterium]|jgi:integrase
MSTENGILIYEDGKIDIHQRGLKYQRYLSNLENDLSIYPENRTLILDFLRDCELGKTVLGRAKKKIGKARCLKYLELLRQISRFFSKPFNEISQSDMEHFILDLENDRIITKAGGPYSASTKLDFKKTIKKFWKWKDGDNRTYPRLVEWIDTCEPLKEFPALSRSEIEMMMDRTANIRDRAIIMVLFDSGARAEEILNVRLKREHLFWKEETGCYMIRLEHSKTKPRTISLPLSTEILKKWLEIHPARDNPNAQLFPMTYPAFKMVVSRLGKRALGKRVTPHMLRHSSATFYANRLKNPYKLCYRYGWSMSSNMVNRYLDREGLIEEETANIVKSDESSVVVKANQRLREELAIVKESQAEMADQYSKLTRELQELKEGKGVLRLLMAMSSERKEEAEAFQALKGKKFGLVLPDLTGSEMEVRK